MKRVYFLSAFIMMTGLVFAQGQVKKAPELKEGDGPFAQLIIRGITMIDGTGAPPQGPVDIVVKQNRIVSVQAVGYPGVDINPERRPKLEAGGKEIDGTGLYIMPGFVDMHGHIGGSQSPNAEYVLCQAG